jgi:PAS domain S-box-containing protein
MTLRKKTLFAIGTTLIGLNTVLYAVSSAVLSNHSASAEEQDIRRSVKETLNIFAQHQNQFVDRWNDWSQWDDVYTFIEDRNPDFIKKNLIDSYLIKEQVNLVVFAPTSGHIVFSKYFTPEKNNKVPLPEEIRKHLSVGKLLFGKDANPKSRLAGIIMLPEGPMLISTQPSLNSAGEGPAGGTIVWGQYLTEAKLKELAELINLSLTVRRFNEPNLPSDFLKARSYLSNKNSIFIQPLSKESIAGYTLIRDIYQKPALLLRVDSPRIIYRRSQEALHYLMAVTFAVGFIFCAVTLLLLEKLVLLRLAYLSTKVTQIGTKGDLSLRLSLPGTDELSNVATSINTMLKSLEHQDQEQNHLIARLQQEISDRISAEAALRLSEDKFSKAFRSSPHPISITTLNEGRFIEVNNSFLEVFGYRLKEVIGRTITELNFWVNLEECALILERLQDTGEVYNQEISFRTKSGTIRTVLLSSEQIDINGNRCILSVINDITERKQIEEYLRAEQEKSELLLLNVLPKVIADQLKQNPGAIAEQFNSVTILFADIVGFTPLASGMSPTNVVNLLNQIFSTFDQLADRHGLEKIKTIGDAYMVAGGLPALKLDHAEAVAEMALDMQREIARFQRSDNQPLSVRIGINTGPVVAGVIGIKKFIYDLWGDTVNVASRMESQGIPGGIQVTAATYECLKNKYLFEERGVIPVKGKGEMITYWLIGKKIGYSI